MFETLYPDSLTHSLTDKKLKILIFLLLFVDIRYMFIYMYESLCPDPLTHSVTDQKLKYSNILCIICRYS